jgi:hypothetical protein
MNGMETKIYPFKFLDSYTKEDKDIFFGRDEETTLLYEMLKQSDIVLVYGASGTGKTSLIQCGLSKKMNDYDWLPFYIRRGANLNDSLLGSLQKFVPDNEDSVSDFLDELLAGSGEQSNAESPVAKAVRSIYTNRFKPVYLVFDQFEELFILGKTEEQKNFVATVKELLLMEQPVKLIFSIREEYLGHLYEFERAVPQLLCKKMRVEAMYLDKVQQILSGINELKNSNIHIDTAETEAFTAKVFEKIKSKNELSIQLPYLQVFLDKLYLSLTSDKTRHADASFTTEALGHLGDIGDILSEFLEEQVSEVSHELRSRHPEADAMQLWEILSPFATLDGTKDPLSKAQLAERLNARPEFIEQVVEAFTTRRILRYSEADDLYEVVHDALAKRIAEKRSEDDIALLQARQLVKSQSALKAQARELFTEKQLSLISPFAEKLKLSPAEKDWIEQSRIAVEAAKLAKVKRQRKIMAGILLAALISLAFGIFGFWQKSKAEKSLAEAVKFQVSGKGKDALSFKNDEKYTPAIAKYKEMLEIYRKFAKFDFDSMAVYEDMKECKTLDSLNKLFVGYMNKADSLIEYKEVEPVQESWVNYRQAKDLKYKYATKRTEPYEIKLEQAIENLKEQARLAKDAGGIGLNISTSIGRFLAEYEKAGTIKKK